MAVISLYTFAKICIAHSSSHGTQVECGQNFALARPGVEKSSVLLDDEVCNPRCYATQMLPWLHLCLFRYAPADETLKSLRPSVKRSKGCASACNFICNIYLDSPHICIFLLCGNICWRAKHIVMLVPLCAAAHLIVCIGIREFAPRLK